MKSVDDKFVTLTLRRDLLRFEKERGLISCTIAIGIMLAILRALSFALLFTFQSAILIITTIRMLSSNIGPGVGRKDRHWSLGLPAFMLYRPFRAG